MPIHSDQDPLDQVFAYRVFDLRDRFPEPLATFRQALECLLSDRAYLPEESGEIVAYLRNGLSITIPPEFFILKEPRFESREAAEVWVRERMADIEAGKSMAKLKGLLIANPDTPFEKQVDEAFSYQIFRLIDPESIDEICARVMTWLRNTIQANDVNSGQ